MAYPDYDGFQRLAGRGNLIPVYREILADTTTPVLALMKLRARPDIFLLESVEGGEKWGRYSFLGVEPHCTFRVRGEDVLVQDKRGLRSFKHKGDPLQSLKEMMRAYRPVNVAGLPRFFGGAVGYFSYDMVRYFERLPTGAKPDPETDDAAFFITDTLLVFDNVKHTLKVVSCAMIEGTADLHSVYKETVGRIDRLVRDLIQPQRSIGESPTESGRNGGTPLFHPNMSPESFKALVKKATEYILAGDIIQVVLSQRFQHEGEINPVDLYRALRYINPSPYLFYLQFRDLTLIGSSPEVMVRREDDVLELKPIAGTRPRGKTEQEDIRLADQLLEDPKERAEHVMLVDLGRNDLGRVARTGSVQVTQLMAVERYSHVMHLVSNIKAQLDRGKDSFDVVRATFPAGTLSGAPKIRAMEIIEELEPSRRGPYGGAVGYFSYTGNMDLCITIRTILIRNDRIYIQAGAGIVADSDPDREYEEVVHKARALVKAVELAASGLEISGGGLSLVICH
jgi:anthranilate synthase component 1